MLHKIKDIKICVSFVHSIYEIYIKFERERERLQWLIFVYPTVYYRASQKNGRVMQMIGTVLFVTEPLTTPSPGRITSRPGQPTQRPGQPTQRPGQQSKMVDGVH